MKLRWKMTALCGVLMAVLVFGLAENMYVQLKSETCQLYWDSLRDTLMRVDSTFSEEAERNCQETMEKNKRNVLLRYLFQSIAPGEAILLVDGETVYGSALRMPDENIELRPGGECVYWKENCLIVGRAGELPQGSTYECYLLEDLNQVVGQMQTIYYGFLKNAALCLAAGLLVLVLIIRIALKPLGKLQQAASQIAGGAYEQRVPMKRKDEVGLLAADFNRMAQAVQTRIDDLTEQNARQQRFLRAVTHEFKTPMTSLMLNVENLQTLRLPETRQQEILSDMDDQLQLLENLVQKLLKLLTLGQAPRCVPVDKKKLAQRTENLSRAELDRWGVSLKVETDDQEILGDEELLCSALRNLLENAARASKSGDTVYLRLLGSTLEVEDSGVGIPPEKIAKLTEPFYTADPSRSKQKGGFGLGLTLVKTIAEALNGTLEIESAPGKGTVARIRLQEGGNGK